MTDLDILRGLIEDLDGTTFSDDELNNIMSQANGFDPIVAPLDLSQMYWSAHLGWLRKAGKIRVKKQKIAIFAKDTYVTYEAAIEQANEYKALSLSAPPRTGTESLIGIFVPSLDTRTGLLDTSLDGTDPTPVNGLAEIW